jgi:hypothetical protein
MAAAILVPLVILGVLRTCWPRATTGARLAAFGAGFAVILVMVALVSLSAAMKLAGWFVLGIVGDIHALAVLIGML